MIKTQSCFTRRNFLSSIIVDGRKLTKEAEIKERVVNAFQNVLSESGNWRPSIFGLSFSSLDSDEAGPLEDVFSKEEIHTALSSLKGDKTPRPDEFILAF